MQGGEAGQIIRAEPPNSTASNASDTCDVALAGAGLANTLLALRLAAAHPGLKIRAIDRHPAVGVARTWCFFETDLSPAQADWLAPFVRYAWPAYEVRFPGLRRVMRTGYRMLDPAALDQALRRTLGAGFRTGEEIAGVDGGGIDMRDGSRISARLVFDGRGARPTSAFRYGWQKFFGLEVQTDGPHGVSLPVVMDASVPQVDGYCFIYVLPLAPDRLLIEETRYSDTREIAEAEFRAAVLAYADREGWRIAQVLDEERGALPVILSGDIGAFWAELDESVAPTGVRAGLAHPTTSYSVPSAVRLAECMADLLPADGRAARAVIAARAQAAWRDQGLYRLINRMLFLAGEPDERWRVLRRFYTMSEPLIRRFYAGQSPLSDKIRIVTGRPPVPFFQAVKCLLPSAASLLPEKSR